MFIAFRLTFLKLVISSYSHWFTMCNWTWNVGYLQWTHSLRCSLKGGSVEEGANQSFRSYCVSQKAIMKAAWWSGGRQWYTHLSIFSLLQFCRNDHNKTGKAQTQMTKRCSVRNSFVIKADPLHLLRERGWGGQKLTFNFIYILNRVSYWTWSTPICTHCS